MLAAEIHSFSRTKEASNSIYVAEDNGYHIAVDFLGNG